MNSTTKVLPFFGSFGQTLRTPVFEYKFTNDIINYGKEKDQGEIFHFAVLDKCFVNFHIGFGYCIMFKTPVVVDSKSMQELAMTIIHQGKGLQLSKRVLNSRIADLHG